MIYLGNSVFETGICDHCSLETQHITVDHFGICYKEIIDRFMNSNSITLENIEIYENDKNTLKLKDIELCSNWKKHHDSIATYRMLCKSCNSSFGSYGYK